MVLVFLITKRRSVSHICSGLNSLLICFELIPFAVYFAKAFDYRPYRPEDRKHTPKRWKALVDALNPWDFIREIWAGFIYCGLLCFGRKATEGKDTKQVAISDFDRVIDNARQGGNAKNKESNPAMLMEFNSGENVPGATVKPYFVYNWDVNQAGKDPTSEDYVVDGSHDIIMLNGDKIGLHAKRPNPYLSERALEEAIIDTTNSPLRSSSSASTTSEEETSKVDEIPENSGVPSYVNPWRPVGSSIHINAGLFGYHMPTVATYGNVSRDGPKSILGTAVPISRSSSLFASDEDATELPRDFTLREPEICLLNEKPMVFIFRK